ncbi:hypothetical protein PC116_g21341 [Phytophthora cactorum]|nr:hypothetical protein PC116_g21341 [Phytophthora cactorum]
MQLHEEVGEDNHTPVRRKAQRGQTSLRIGVDRPQQVTRDLAANRRVCCTGENQEAARNERDCHANHTRHACGVTVLALERRDNDTSTVRESQVAECSSDLLEGEIRRRHTRVTTHAVHHDGDADNISDKRAHATSESSTSPFLQSRHQAHRQTSESHEDDPRRGAEGFREKTIEKTTTKHQEHTRDQEAVAHLRDNGKVAASFAHAPFTEVTVGLDRTRSDEHDAADSHRGIRVGEGHKCHGDDRDHWAGAGKVTGHTKRSNAVDAAEEVEGRFSVFDRKDSRASHCGVGYVGHLRGRRKMGN